MTKYVLDQKPNKTPPENGKAKATSSRQAAPSENIAMASNAGAKAKAAVAAKAQVSPSLSPITAATVERLSEMFGVWNDYQTITGLWTINQDRNTWMWVNNIGWKKLSTASESGIVALTKLASHAKQVGSIVNFRDESDGMVHEMYVWY